jgi:Prohead core protein serine protease
MRQMLVEYITSMNKPLSNEMDTDGKKLWLKGTAVQGDVVNANERLYPRDEIANAVNTIMKRISEHGPVAGELDHPEGLIISGQNVSHAIHSMRMEGSDGYAEMLVINEGNGKIVRGMIEAGIALGVSSRGSGSVDSKGRVSDFEIVSIDIVTTPSAPNAYPKPVFESLRNNKIGCELQYISEIRGDKASQKYFSKCLNDFLMNIRDEIIWNKK